MAQEQSGLVTTIGFGTFENVYTLIFMGVLNGVYLLAFAMGMSIVLDTRRDGGVNKRMIALLVASFFMTVLFFMGYVMATLVLVQLELMNGLPGDVVFQEVAASTQLTLVGAAVVDAWSVVMSMLIVDTFIVWMAWVVWPENKGLHWAFSILMLVNIGLSLAVAISGSRNSAAVLKATTNTLDWVRIFWSLIVNVVATLSMGYRGWKHHKSMQIMLAPKQKTRVVEILLLLVESGAAFGFIQLLNVILVALNADAVTGSPLDKVTNFLLVIYVYTAALNPVGIAVLIRLRRNYGQSLQMHISEHPAINQTQLSEFHSST